MKLYIDGDGCPVIPETLSVAKKFNLDVIIIKNIHHHIVADGATIITVDPGRDAADYAIANRIQKGDLVISQDFGLAAMILARGGLVLTPYGLRVTPITIDEHLARRHFNREMRLKHHTYTKHKKRKSEDQANYIEALTQLLEEVS